MTKPFSQANKALIALVTSCMGGAKLAKLLASIDVLDQSLAQGQWIMRGKVKAESGFYQGFLRTRDYGPKEGDFDLHMVLSFGQKPRNVFQCSQAVNRLEIPRKFNGPAIHAWVSLCAAKAMAMQELDEARPKPVLTKIGLSPKVTKTLQEMDLDIDVQTIKPAVIKFRWVHVFDENTGEQIKNDNGTNKREKQYYVAWSRGIKHGMSRFANSSGWWCEACGKQIPSGLFSPIEGFDRKSSKQCSFWIGLDCARNIFGVKDIGIKKP